MIVLGFAGISTCPAQSGSDRILKLMNRGYTAGQYIEFIDRARAMMPDICIASDFIVGFPTETDEDFEKTAAMVRYCRFKNSFIFKYSPRPGTVAMRPVRGRCSPRFHNKRRNNDLLAVQQEVCAENYRQMVGKTVSVMVEGQCRLASKLAYPSSRNGVELGWEMRRGEVAITSGEEVWCSSSAEPPATRSSPLTATCRSRDYFSMSKSSTHGA